VCTRFVSVGYSNLHEKRSQQLNIFQEEWLKCNLLLLLFFRRDTKPVDSYSFSSPLFGSRKRVIIPESTKKTPDENLINKKSKVISDNDSSEMLHSQTQKDSVIQKRKNRASGIEKTNVSMVIPSFDFDQLLYNLDQRRLD